MASNYENKRAAASNCETGLSISRSFILINNDDTSIMATYVNNYALYLTVAKFRSRNYTVLFFPMNCINKYPGSLPGTLQPGRSEIRSELIKRIYSFRRVYIYAVTVCK